MEGASNQVQSNADSVGKGDVGRVSEAAGTLVSVLCNKNKRSEDEQLVAGAAAEEQEHGG